MSEPNTATRDAPAEWDSDLLKALYELVFSLPDREVAGVLVGSCPEGSGRGLPLVRAAIPATQGFVPGQAATFAHHTWAQIHEVMARHYSGLETVGWYLSRPGQGTGLAAADVANHARWFARRDQILLVVDSRTHRAAIYTSGMGGLTRLTEGPVARRYTRPANAGFPLAAVALISMIGVAVGALVFLVAQVMGS